MNRQHLIVWIGLAFFHLAFKPITLTWERLTDVWFEDKYSTEVEAYYYYPHFGKSVKEMDGKEVQITGYMLPIDPAKGIYILSRYPYSACFFCGNSGPESIIEPDFKGTHRKFRNDEVVTLKGILKLNQDDMYKSNYLLEEAVEVR